MPLTSKIKTTELLIQGLIQGVGFRPFIYRLAHEYTLHGIVYNQNNGVIVHLQGESNDIREFIGSIKKKAPLAAKIKSINQSKIQKEPYLNFSIQKSKTVDKSITQVSPDIAICQDCLEDIKRQKRRTNNSFTSCTNCGPRFSIIEHIPYDRIFTSMKEFEMCPECTKEYNTILDRRFHAQPITCNNCGPKYSLITKNQGTDNNIDSILKKTNQLFKNSGIAAIKGLGGYLIACDAFNAKAVKRLRQIKVRDGKPFAVMVKDVDTAKTYAKLSLIEEEQLTSWRRPIVLVESNYPFPESLCNNLTTLGIFLPYLPFHYQLFNAVETNALVMTSGNISDCPIIIDNEMALETFGKEVDAVLTHNRGIINRVDDSVVHQIKNQTQIIRRSRGYAPLPIEVETNTEGIFATGAELSNTFGIGKGKQVILSQHIGDLKNLETMEFFEQSFKAYQKLFEFTPTHVVCDMHPDYLSTKFAETLGLPQIKTQHHHAHIATTMAEYGLDEPVIGIAFDGTGYGTDTHIWGSEIMVTNLTNFERKYHFDYVPIPGGDRVAKQPWRSAYSYLYKAYYGDIPENLQFLEDIKSQEISLVNQAIKNEINTPLSCSAGRLFDAVSALINLCSHASYHAEAPILLEHSISKKNKEHYPIELASIICWNETIKSIVNDLNNKISSSIISTKFHNTVIHIIIEGIKKIHLETGITKVILSGGTFQNKYMSENLLDLLIQIGFQVYMSQKVPVNDGGLALGQIAIAAKQLAVCV